MGARDWRALYNQDDPSIGQNLAEAKAKRLKHYKNVCQKHGPTIFLVVDNSCPHCCAERNKVRRAANPDVYRTREAIGTIRRRAKERGIECTITPEDLRSRLIEVCPVLGIELKYVPGMVDTSLSVDRFDSSVGYIPDNIRLMSTRANRIKSDGSLVEHLRIAIWMAKEYGLSQSDVQALITNQLKEFYR